MAIVTGTKRPSDAAGRASTTGDSAPKTVVEETHPALGVSGRTALKWCLYPDEIEPKLREWGFNTERDKNGALTIWREGDSNRYRLDPNTGTFSADIGGDALELVPIASKWGVTAVLTAEKLLGLLGYFGGPAVGTVTTKAAMLTAAGTAAGVEIINQGACRLTGVRDQIRVGKVVQAGVIAGALPGAGDLIRKRFGQKVADTAANQGVGTAARRAGGDVVEEAAEKAPEAAAKVEAVAKAGSEAAGRGATDGAGRLTADGLARGDASALAGILERAAQAAPAAEEALEKLAATGQLADEGFEAIETVAMGVVQKIATGVGGEFTELEKRAIQFVVERGTATAKASGELTFAQQLVSDAFHMLKDHRLVDLAADAPSVLRATLRADAISSTGRRALEGAGSIPRATSHPEPPFRFDPAVKAGLDGYFQSQLPAAKAALDIIRAGGSPDPEQSRALYSAANYAVQRMREGEPLDETMSQAFGLVLQRARATQAAGRELDLIEQNVLEWFAENLTL